MPTTACLPLHTPAASILTKNLNPRTFTSCPPISKKACSYNPIICRATSSCSSSITDFDLYDLLGIDSSSDQSRIKTAYRTLQKRCHPDIAGPTGHDMAIILNEAYSVLSDPSSRLAYDKEQAKIAELRGYTGKPLYSSWFGSECEKRAVFVDEVKCVGCLKCALFAQKTFAIESVYGRERVVAQWADPEHKIRAAIESCPVDCISLTIVERSDLAALEFLMSKQPRGNVRVGVGNAAGARVSNIFIDVKKFQTRFTDAKNTASSQSSMETDLQREARISAIQAIRSITNWMYWQTPKASSRASESHQNLILIAQKSTEPNINKLRKAAAARKCTIENRKQNRRTPSNNIYHDEYWIPSTHALPASSSSSGTNCRSTQEASHMKELQDMDKADTVDYKVVEKKERNPITSAIPSVISMGAAINVGLQVGVRAAGGLNEHIAGSLALDVVNSSLLQVTLAGIIWYFIGVVALELAEAIQNRL